MVTLATTGYSGSANVYSYGVEVLAQSSGSPVAVVEGPWVDYWNGDTSIGVSIASSAGGFLLAAIAAQYHEDVAISVTSMSGGGLTWFLLGRGHLENTIGDGNGVVDVEYWGAYAAASVSATITATLSTTCFSAFSIVRLSNVKSTSPTGVTSGMTATVGNLTRSFSGETAGSRVFAAGYKQEGSGDGYVTAANADTTVSWNGYTGYVQFLEATNASVGTGTVDLLAEDLTSGTPTLGTPAIHQVHALLADDVAVGVPTLGTPALHQVHALLADDVAVGVPTLGTPALHQVHALLADDVAVGVPTLGTPTLHQVHALLADDLGAGTPTLGTPVVHQVHALLAEDLAAGAPTLGTPTLAQVAALFADDLTAGDPTLGTPTIHQVHALLANDLAAGTPTLGAPTLNAETGGDVSGSSLCWPFSPQIDVVESIEWETDVISCRTQEWRHCIRPIPRQEFAYDFLLKDFQYGRAKELAKILGGDEFYLPVWEDFAPVGAVALGETTLPVDAAGRCYAVGGHLVVWADAEHYEVCAISSIGTGTVTINLGTNAAYADALVAPVRRVTWAQEFEGERGPMADVRAQGRFTAVVTEDLSGASGGLTYPTYLTYPVVTSPVVILGSSTERFGREVEVLDSGGGLLRKLPTKGGATQGALVSWFVRTRAELYALRIWLHQRKGRWRAFWLPSQNPDITITSPISAGATSIAISAVGYASHFPAVADFAIVTTDGTHVGIRVVGSEEGSPGHEVLTLDAPIASAISLSAIRRTSRLVLSRFDSDRVEIQHRAGTSATISMPVVEVPAP